MANHLSGRIERLTYVPPERSSAPATLRDVVLVVRADEAHHRDVNHRFANELAGMPVDEAAIAPSPPHEGGIRIAA